MNLRIPEELNEISIEEFFDMAELFFYTGEDDGPKEATQEDIQRFFG